MQPLDALTLQHLAAELDVKLADAKVNKIQQASHYELLINFWTGGDAGRQKFYVNIRPEYAFACLAQDTGFLTFPEKAANFCMVLRKHLTSARVKRVYTLPGERVLNIVMDNYNELGQHVNLVLALELMGKNSNIILYDEELKMILGCAHGVSSEMSRMREISVGYPYVPPPQQDKPLFSHLPQSMFTGTIAEAQAQGEAPEAFLVERFMGMGKTMLADLLATSDSPEKAYQTLMESYQGLGLYPCLRKDYQHFSLFPGHQEQADWLPVHSVNRLVDGFFMRHLGQEQLRQSKHQLAQILKGQQKKLQQRRREVEQSDLAGLDVLRKSGDLLTLAHSQRTPAEGSKVMLHDYETDSPMTLEIDPHLNLLENAQVYYRRYKKGQARLARAQQVTEELDHQQGFITEQLSALERAGSREDMASIREDLVAHGWLKDETAKKKSGQAQRSTPLRLISSEGMTILIGRNGLQNEQIVGKLSRPEDLWFHTHLMPGSHVLLKTERQTPSNRTLEEAAMCAVWFSDGREGVNVPVVYTESRYVRKIPGSYPGHVNYTHEQAINITPDKALLERILGSKAGSGSEIAKI